MKLIFCVENSNGLTLFGKRLSRDAALISRISALTEDVNIWMNAYSAKLFADVPNVRVDDDYLSRAGENDYCFIENGCYCLDGVSEVVICRWNRDYPADRFLNLSLDSCGFVKRSTETVLGTSHPAITLDFYQRGDNKS